MTFDYGYRDSTNARLTGTVEASSRDDAYRQLKEKGIRPTFVKLAPGFGNRLSALGKRGWSIVVLGALLVIVLATLLAQIKQSNNPTIQQSSSPLTRRQIYGDPALMEELQAENYASLFANEGDRVLAHFAQPALIDHYVATLKKDATARAKAAAALAELQDSRQKTEDRGGAPSPSASRERSELTRIVLWMRGEFDAYLAGSGTPEGYLARLLERQQYEADFYARAKCELEGVTDPAVYERRNDELRAIGAPTIPLPRAEEE